MVNPARKARGAVPACTRLPRLLSVATTGAVFIGAGLGVPPASADTRSAQEQSVTVDVVGDSYMAGDGLRDTDPADPRHRSASAPALQALARVRNDDPRLRVDANLVAAAGARTADFFFAQTGPNDSVVSPPQRDQVRPDAQLVIVGFGGDDARLAAVLAEAKRTTGGPNTALDKEIRALGPLLDWTASDEEYVGQAKSSPPGQAPTLVARMLQVLAGIAARAPHAEIVVTTYPLAADPENAHATSLVGEDDLTSVRKFGYDLNKAIDRAVRICGCGSLADLAEAVAGHEIYTPDSVFAEQGDRQEPFEPNDKGASLIANPIADSVAKVLRIPPPQHSDGQVTPAKNIQIRYGVSDRDGDTVADSQDTAPDDPTRSTDKPHPDGDARTDRRSSRPIGLRPVIQVAYGSAPGVSLVGPHDRAPVAPRGEQDGNRPPAREQAVPVEHTAPASEPAAAPPVPGNDTPALSQAQLAAMRDVVSKAEHAGYVSRYSAPALRASTVPAEVRGSLDMRAVDRQMSGSLLSDLPDPSVRDGFRARFGEDIGAIHTATTPAEQDAAIARFNETATQYNATELAARDAYGVHPVDALGDTVRVTPASLAEETAADDQADVGTVTTVSDQETALSAFGSNVPTVATGVKTGPAAEVGVAGQTEVGGVTISGEAGAKALGGEANASAGTSKDGVNAKVGASGYLSEATAEGSATYGPAEVGVKGEAEVSAEAGANVSLGFESVDVGAKGFAGAKVGVDGHADVAGLRVAGTAEGWSGLGAEGRARFGWGPDGSFTIGADAGVAVGIGGKLGFSITLSPAKTPKALSVEEAAEPDQAPPSDFDADYSGPTPGTTGENDAPGEVTAPETTGENTEPAAPDAGISSTGDATETSGANDADSAAGSSNSGSEGGIASGDAAGSGTGDSATGDSGTAAPGGAGGDSSGSDSGSATSGDDSGSGAFGGDSGDGASDSDSGSGASGGDSGSGASGGDSGTGASGSDSGSGASGGDSGSGASGGDSGGAASGGDSGRGASGGDSGSGASGGDSGGAASGSDSSGGASGGDSGSGAASGGDSGSGAAGGDSGSGASGGDSSGGASGGDSSGGASGGDSGSGASGGGDSGGGTGGTSTGSGSSGGGDGGSGGGGD
ncbi:hypothetical protein VA596_15210 [Amycolatopsis sp., V23-08]|uniref:SGNH hydrolase-type esterase domain-containing protein n=1 Tax=Amycolatopsis heterodermiae TaxID=3110235 RepID=A0ABU5R5C7_9PSEU|nr:hypothetical protein [Amycolatopsis sp., V23-08]MEA5360895.1 hypothetical protein [Amycolatopsis sp., V23-08]